MGNEQSTGNEPVTTNTGQDLNKFGAATVAFDDMIVQVGRGIARAQEMMDLSQIEFQKKVVRAFQEGKLKRLNLNPSNAYAIPETSLNIKVGMSMQFPEDGGEPTLSAVPLNAGSTSQNDINIEAATEIKLKFVSVPSSKEPPGPQPSALSKQQAVTMASEELSVKEIVGDGTGYTLVIDYAEDARLWHVAWLKAKEPEVVVFIDDRKSKVLDVIYKVLPPVPDDVANIGEPSVKEVIPAEGIRGEKIDLIGDNFLTLSGQTILTVDGNPVPMIRHTMEGITFKVPAWSVRGDIEVITPFGRTGESGRGLLTPLPSFKSFQPAKGRYDANLMKGTKLTIYGDNFRAGCNIRFATGVFGKNPKVLSSSAMEVEVPDGAATGPLTLTFGNYEQALTTIFAMLPTIEGFTPKQARVGEEVVITGTRLESVDEIVIGKSIILRADFVFHVSTQIRFIVPSDARDGRLILREENSGQLFDTSSQNVFYVIPRIAGFNNTIVSPGEFLTIAGEGLDTDPRMMTILFEGERGITMAEVIAVSEDRKFLTVRVPDDAVTGFVRLIRKRVYSGFAPEDTSSISKNKITVLKRDGLPADVMLEERFTSDLSKWKAEAGQWTIDTGALVCKQTGRLAFFFSESPSELFVYIDILNAEVFGFSFLSAADPSPLQLWISMSSQTSTLTWSKSEVAGEPKVLAGMTLPFFSGKNYFVQIKISQGKITLFIDQEEIHSFDWAGAGTLTNVSLLSNSEKQGWDNVLLLKKDYLRIPEPDFYRFGEVPESSPIPEVIIEKFLPENGAIGTEVTITGSGFLDVRAFYFGSIQATTKTVTNVSAVVVVPEGATTGTIEAEVRGGHRISSGEKEFVLPPAVTSLVPAKVMAGSELNIIGVNLPAFPEETQVKILGMDAEVLSASHSLVRVRIPDVRGSGLVSIGGYGFTALSPVTLEVIREQIVLDLLADAENATWKTNNGSVVFGAPGEGSDGIVAVRKSERMEDGNTYSPVLYLHPPAPSGRALRGEYPMTKIPQGRMEMRLALGMLWTAAPIADDITEVDGVIFEVSFMPAGESEIPLLPKSACVHDGSIEHFVIDASDIAGKDGQLILSVFPGRNGLRDDTAVLSAKLVVLS
jgi:hypothetical protein